MISIRPITHQDSMIFQDTSYGTMDDESLQSMICESIARSHDGRYFEMFAVYCDEACVGFVSLYACVKTEVSCGPEINPQYRMHGFAYDAVILAMDYAKSIGYKTAVAQIRQDNEASIALHKKLGFSLIKEFTNNRGKLVYWFEKDL